MRLKPTSRSSLRSRWKVEREGADVNTLMWLAHKGILTTCGKQSEDGGIKIDNII